MRLAALLALTVARTDLAAHPTPSLRPTWRCPVEAGAVTGVRLAWTYDDLFSLILAEDLGTDAHGDLQPSDAGLAARQAHVADWPSDYAGDLVV